MDVVNFSQKTKQEADELLKQGSVLEVLSKYGETVIVGSYKYDLMWGPDIDLVVLTDVPFESSIQALNDFIGLRNFRKYQLGDFIKFPLKNRTDGIIVVLICEFEGRKWEIEIWFRKSLPEKEEYFNRLLSNISDSQRKIILEIKSKRDSNGLSKNQLASTTIYEEVVNGEKTKLEDF